MEEALERGDMSALTRALLIEFGDEFGADIKQLRNRKSKPGRPRADEFTEAVGEIVDALRRRGIRDPIKQTQGLIDIGRSGVEKAYRKFKRATEKRTKEFPLRIRIVTKPKRRPGN
jgi:hypothetical protein